MFEGTYTALVTPFRKDGEVDYDRLRLLVDYQVEGGVDGLVPVGTTGESPTLTYEEHKKVIETVVEAAAGRVKVVAGTGGNATAEALELTAHAKAVGADGTLQVTPYYSKPSQEGLIRHFEAVANIGLPVVLYNIPGRTAKELTLDTVLALAKHPGIVAIKEAAGDVDRVSHYTRLCDLIVLSGDDSLTLPKMAVGAKGVISVASNVAPRAISEMVNHALKDEWPEARALHLKYHRLFTDLFLETNPVPVKAALSMMGRAAEVYRLPLCAMSADKKAILQETMKEVGLL